MKLCMFFLKNFFADQYKTFGRQYIRGCQTYKFTRKIVLQAAKNLRKKFELFLHFKPKNRPKISIFLQDYVQEHECISLNFFTRVEKNLAGRSLAMPAIYCQRTCLCETLQPIVNIITVHIYFYFKKSPPKYLANKTP